MAVCGSRRPAEMGRGGDLGSFSRTNFKIRQKSTPISLKNPRKNVILENDIIGDVPRRGTTEEM